MAGKKKDYRVGYGKPPEHTRFRKGQSGNPSGKPRKVLSDDEILLRELSSRVTITEGGKRKRMTKLEVMMKKLVNLAMQGDSKAVRFVADAYRNALANQPPANEDDGEPVMRVTLVFEEEERRRLGQLREENPDYSYEDPDEF